MGVEALCGKSDFWVIFLNVKRILWRELWSRVEEQFMKKFQEQTRLKQRKRYRFEVGTIKYQCLGSKSSRNIQIRNL